MAQRRIHRSNSVLKLIQVTIDVRLHMYIINKIIVFASDDAGPSSETSITSTDATVEPVDGTLVSKNGESGRGQLKNFPVRKRTDQHTYTSPPIRKYLLTPLTCVIYSLSPFFICLILYSMHVYLPFQGCIHRILSGPVCLCIHGITMPSPTMVILHIIT